MISIIFDIREHITLQGALLAILLWSANAASAQGIPPETLEKAKALGISRDMKTLPAGTIPPNTHYSKTPPSNFPVAIYTSNVVSTHFLNSTSGAPRASLIITSKDQPSSVFQFYQSSLRSTGWSLQIPDQNALNKLAPSGQIFMIRAAKDGQESNVMVQTLKGSGSTLISIDWQITPVR